MLTPNGTFVRDVFPFPTRVVQSVRVAEGEAVMGIGKRYFAGLGMAKNGKIEYGDEYHFLEDERVYLIKLYANGLPMQIGFHRRNQDAQGAEQIEVHGKTLMSWLERRMILTQITSTGLTGQQLLRQLLTQNLIAPADPLRQIPLTALFTREDYADTPIADYQSEEHACLLDGVEGLLATAELGLRVVTDPTVPIHRFDIFRGPDLTADQSEREP